MSATHWKDAAILMCFYLEAVIGPGRDHCALGSNSIQAGLFLSLQGLYICEQSTTAMLVVFPILWKSGVSDEAAKLRLSHCHFSGKSLSLMSCHLNLHELTWDENTTFMSGEICLAMRSSRMFKSLQVLSFSARLEDDHGTICDESSEETEESGSDKVHLIQDSSWVCRALSHLTQLRSLTLGGNTSLQGIDKVLNNVPLTDLHFTGNAPKLHIDGTYFGSLTIQTLSMHCEPLTFCFRASDFPALQSFRVLTLDFSSCRKFDAWTQQQCCEMAVAISSFPLSGRAKHELTITGPGHVPCLLESMLQALAPIQSFFLRVKCLRILNCVVSCGAMAVLSQFFPNLKKLTFLNRLGNLPYSDPTGLLDAVKGMPQLVILRINVGTFHPGDLLAACTVARQGQRRMRFLVEAGHEVKDAVSNVAEQWKRMQELLPGPATISVDVWIVEC